MSLQTLAACAEFIAAIVVLAFVCQWIDRRIAANTHVQARLKAVKALRMFRRVDWG
jgi:hypothetical protein